MADPNPTLIQAPNAVLDRLERELAKIIDEEGELSGVHSLSQLLSTDQEMARLKTLDELGFDSLGTIECGMAIETRYHFDIPDDVANRLYGLPLSSIALYVYNRLQERQ
ncbi:hypothetical protein HY501_02110 [Candidatus Woesearchaeota archaeon]|nr:hypothetical protein [Candidatus Woesearchaeota archaeon]